MRHMKRLPYNHPEHEKSISTYWRGRALEAEHELSELSIPTFYIGQLVERTGYLCWGVGIVEGIFRDSMTCRVCWIREDKSYQSTVELPWGELQLSLESGLDIGVPALYEC